MKMGRSLTIIFFALTMSVSAQVDDSNVCDRIVVPRAEFESRIDHAEVTVHWYSEWLEKHDGQKMYPDPLLPIEKWNHPQLNNQFPSSMHEDSYSSDVSNYQGPLADDIEVQYFHVLEKGGKFSGMVPAFNFIAEDTLVVLSFGRAKTHLLLLYVGDTIKQLDQVEVPGRGSSALELAGKKARMAIFRNTMGGAYSYLAKDRYMYIPGANNDIIRVPIGNGKFDLDRVEYVNMNEQMSQGDMVDKHLTKKEKKNNLTAIMPDAEGNVWFTSQHGIVGVIHHSELTGEGCPKVYANFIGWFGIVPKINHILGIDIQSEADLPEFMKGFEKMSPEFRKQFREYFMVDKNTSEEIQNSFAVGTDGVYIVTNIALYKLRFNEEKKEIEMDPAWEKNFIPGGLIYDNDGLRKPGHLNNGSGTSPTLLDDRFVAIVDNDTSRVNICIFSQETGQLISRHALFEEDGSAVENSIIAYKNSLIVGNTYAFVDPFVTNETPGGIHRFDYDSKTGTFIKLDNWPPYLEPFDCKMATPKLSTKSGLVYVYNRDDERGPTEHEDWQLTALDFRTGMRVFSIKPMFDKNGFDDNISGLMKGASLGKKNYDRKVFNNLMGTFAFGPNNSLYIGAYRGFIRFRSSDRPR